MGTDGARDACRGFNVCGSSKNEGAGRASSAQGVWRPHPCNGDCNFADYPRRLRSLDALIVVSYDPIGPRAARVRPPWAGDALGGEVHRRRHDPCRGPSLPFVPSHARHTVPIASAGASSSHACRHPKALKYGASPPASCQITGPPPSARRPSMLHL